MVGGGLLFDEGVGMTHPFKPVSQSMVNRGVVVVVVSRFVFDHAVFALFDCFVVVPFRLLFGYVGVGVGFGFRLQPGPVCPR